MDRRFVFVHGAGHGAWCWYKVVDKLQQNAGRQAIALDLCSAGTSSVDANDVRTLADYSKPLVELLEALPQGEKVILVGHSMGGVSLSYAMEEFPDKLAAAVFVAASMFPGGDKGQKLYNQIFQASDFRSRIDYFYKNSSSTPTSAMVKSELRKDLFYHLCSSEDVVLANMLLKPSPILPPSEVIKTITPEKYGRVPRFYVKTMQDKTAPAVCQELYIDNNPPEGVFELEADHSPFFSCPDALVEVLIKISSAGALA